MRGFGQEAQPAGPANLVLHLAGQAIGGVWEVQVFGLRKTGRTLHGIRGDGNHRPPQLGGQPERLFAGKIMHGLWSMGQMMFTKYLVVVDDDVDVHNTSEVLFRLCANTAPQRDSLFTKDPSDVLDHATSEIAMGSKLGIDATKKLPGESFKRPWPPLLKMNAAVKAKVETLPGDAGDKS